MIVPSCIQTKEIEAINLQDHNYALRGRSRLNFEGNPGGIWGAMRRVNDDSKSREKALHMEFLYIYIKAIRKTVTMMA